MINCLRSFKYRLTRNTLETMYTSFILPNFDYCFHIWDNCKNEQSLLLENLHLDALRTICGAVRGTSHVKIYNETNFQSLKERRHRFKLITFYKMKNSISPVYLTDLIPSPISDNSNYNLRNRSNIQTIKCRTQTYG